MCDRMNKSVWTTIGTFIVVSGRIARTFAIQSDRGNWRVVLADNEEVCIADGKAACQPYATLIGLELA